MTERQHRATYWYTANSLNFWALIKSLKSATCKYAVCEGDRGDGGDELATAVKAKALPWASNQNIYFLSYMFVLTFKVEDLHHTIRRLAAYWIWGGVKPGVWETWPILADAGPSWRYPGSLWLFSRCRAPWVGKGSWRGTTFQPLSCQQPQPCFQAPLWPSGPSRRGVGLGGTASSHHVAPPAVRQLPTLDSVYAKHWLN